MNIKENRSCLTIAAIIIALLICVLFSGCAPSKLPTKPATAALTKHLQEAKAANLAAFGEYKGIKSLNEQITLNGERAQNYFSKSDGKTLRALQILDYIIKHQNK